MSTPPTPEVHHPVFARLFAAGGGAVSKSERRQRSQLLEDLKGRVLEVGCGAGFNFVFYPRSVVEVVAIEPEAYLRARATSAAERAPVPVRVEAGVAEHLPIRDGEVDAVVFSLVLCSVADQGAALAEAYRVLRPGGELRFFEHVAAEGGIALILQRWCDATFWPMIAGGCHCSRDTGAAIRAAGFEVLSVERMAVKPLGIPSPPAPHILGRARRPGPAGESQP